MKMRSISLCVSICALFLLCGCGAGEAVDPTDTATPSQAGEEAPAAGVVDDSDVQGEDFLPPSGDDGSGKSGQDGNPFKVTED
jgi:hypothetical protein